MDEFSRRVALDAREITEAQFVAKYAHPFLSIDAGEDADAGEFSTSVSSEFVEITPPSHEALGHMPDETIAPVGKRPGANSYSFITIGRAANNDVVVALSSISKFHAVIHREQGRYTVADAGSRNGTLFNGKPLVANQPVAIQSGDILMMGEQVRAKFRDARALYTFLHR